MYSVLITWGALITWVVSFKSPIHYHITRPIIVQLAKVEVFFNYLFCLLQFIHPKLCPLKAGQISKVYRKRQWMLTPEMLDWLSMQPINCFCTFQRKQLYFANSKENPLFAHFREKPYNNLTYKDRWHLPKHTMATFALPIVYSKGSSLIQCMVFRLFTYQNTQWPPLPPYSIFGSWIHTALSLPCPEETIWNSGPYSMYVRLAKGPTVFQPDTFKNTL